MASKLPDPHQFPGGKGTLLNVTTNMFPLNIRKPNVIQKVNVVAFVKAKDGKKTQVEGNKVFSLFKKAYGSMLDKQYGVKHIIEGYPTNNGINVYVVTPRNLVFKDTKLGFNEVCAKSCGSININNWKTFDDNDLKMFMKKSFATTIFEMFDKHRYALMKGIIYSFKTEGSFPAVFLNSIFQLLPGIRLGYEMDIPNENDPLRSNNMVSINHTQTVSTRVNIGLLKCYEEMCAEVITNLTSGNLRGIDTHANANQKIPQKCVDLMNEVFQNMEVYIPQERVKDCGVYYKFVEILPKSAKAYAKRVGRNEIPIIAYYENLYKIKIKYPGMNAVLLKRNGKTSSFPLELVVLSDKPQRVAASATYIMTRFSERMKELAALVPGKRWEYIRGAAGKFHADLQHANRPNLLKEIGLELDDVPVTVPARVLDTLGDTYSESGTLAFAYQNPVEYCIVDFHRVRDSNDGVEENINHLMEKMRDTFEIAVTTTRALTMFKFDMGVQGDQKVLNNLEEVVKWHNVNKSKNTARKLLYVVVIDNVHKTTKLHGLIKQKFEKNGMLSQVITIGVLQNTRASYRPAVSLGPSEDYTCKLALQINGKLGGVNCVPSQSNELWHKCINDENPTMFIGIDTRLPPEKKKQSVVVLLTSTDTTGSCYNDYATLSKDGRYTADFSKAVTKAIDLFKDSKGNSIVPKNYLIFRAGMNDYELSAKAGEGSSEIKRIKETINNYMKRKRITITPKLTYIGYNRSHNFRCYNSKLEDSTKEEDGVKLNCPPGTVVDSKVVGKDCFYLISHETFLGTTKPPKYRVVEGLKNYPVDTLLAIVYQLCRMNPQTNQSFRRPVPIGLASKLLDRIVEKSPKIFDGKPDQIEVLSSHPDFKTVAYVI